MDPISAGVDILEKLGVLETVKNKLLNNPDMAAAKLSLVFIELRKAYQALDDTISTFCAMSFEDPDGRWEALEFLNKARVGNLGIAMLEAKGGTSCVAETQHARQAPTVLSDADGFYFWK